MVKQDYATACPKFAESQRLDPASGTLLNLAVCHELQGKLATAWSEYKEVIALARKEANQQREALASKRTREIEPKLSKLAVVVPEGVRVPGLVVILDGVPVGEPAWGVAAPADQGAHVIEARAHGRVAWKTQVELLEAGVREVTIPVLEPQPSATAPLATTPPTGPRRTAAPVASAPEGDRAIPVSADSRSSAKTLGYVLSGGGVVLLGVAGYLGVRAANKWSERNDNCPQGQCNAAAVDASDDAHRSALIADAAVVAGLASLGIGGYLLLTSNGRDSPSVGPTPRVSVAPGILQRGASLGIHGSF